MIARASVVYALCACVMGCAAPGSLLTTVSAHNAKDAISIGKSTKSDVIAALGKTKGISFDSGFEVWVYHVTGDAPAGPGSGELFGRAGLAGSSLGKTEFVILFAPSGVVTKTRIRPPPPPGAAKGT